MRAGRSAFEALGIHPVDAERMSRRFVANDRHAMLEMAKVYDPEVPDHENAAYVARSRELMQQREAQLHGERPGFGSRHERAWSPPTPGDVEAESRAADED